MEELAQIMVYKDLILQMSKFIYGSLRIDKCTVNFKEFKNFRAVEFKAFYHAFSLGAVQFLTTIYLDNRLSDERKELYRDFIGIIKDFENILSFINGKDLKVGNEEEMSELERLIYIHQLNYFLMLERLVDNKIINRVLSKSKQTNNYEESSDDDEATESTTTLQSKSDNYDESSDDDEATESTTTPQSKSDDYDESSDDDEATESTTAPTTTATTSTTTTTTTTTTAPTTTSTTTTTTTTTTSTSNTLTRSLKNVKICSNHFNPEKFFIIFLIGRLNFIINGETEDYFVEEINNNIVVYVYAKTFKTNNKIPQQTLDHITQQTNIIFDQSKAQHIKSFQLNNDIYSCYKSKPSIKYLNNNNKNIRYGIIKNIFLIRNNDFEQKLLIEVQPYIPKSNRFLLKEIDDVLGKGDKAMREKLKKLLEYNTPFYVDENSPTEIINVEQLQYKVDIQNQ
ncbi:hypothetical protein PPL_11451 [Heterostelium album PN500]|uniref:Uncharacterized protein n=1 Tax=Heterostelium pallidum (strain ATCC 26659 / Pp 5 / PN500) TaxID=670386 RepID=D3BTF7_HETP5|nr:hypothetical protein PPL_11451 [Heterostelium album PN500]EFA75374.1 hypothetical protein PPL_11451 [Heterostelium album PN500]|eukprot:XP_020427508.1 hypothetical protein PPL_11451 [Heterostelium album PN500]